jgi:hypothetical protein
LSWHHSNAFSSIHQIFLDQLSESIGVVLNVIMANMRTEELLQQSQGFKQELQNQSKELTHQQETLKSTNTAHSNDKGWSWKKKQNSLRSKTPRLRSRTAK